MGNNVSFDSASYNECISAISQATTELMMANSADDKASIHWKLSMEMGKVASNPNLSSSQISEIQAKLGALIGASS